jgi:hypothetical protein
VKVECIKCGGSGRNGSRWKPVGYRERVGRRPVAYLECLCCGGRFYSALPEAVEAAKPLAEGRVVLVPPERNGFTVPAPTLFGGGLSPQSQGFSKVGTAASGRSAREVVDWARRAAGERDE